VDWNSMNTTDHLPDMEGPDAISKLTTAEGNPPTLEELQFLLGPLMGDQSLSLREVANGVAEVAQLYGICFTAAIIEIDAAMQCLKMDKHGRITMSQSADNDFHAAVHLTLTKGYEHLFDVLLESVSGLAPHVQLLAVAVPVLERTGMSVAEAVEVLRSWDDGEGER